MKPYADTNLFARTYLQLPGSDEADAMLISAQVANAAPLPVTWLHRVEIVSAFEFSVWLGKQPDYPRVTGGQAAAALANFRADLAANTFLETQRLPETELINAAEDLALRHTARRGFRTYDLLHVASALLLNCDHFWSFDIRALELARLEGLRIPSRKRR